MERALGVCFVALFVAAMLASIPAGAQDRGDIAVGPILPGRLGPDRTTPPELPTCDPSPVRAAEGTLDHRRLVVTTAYCAILRRPPDGEGLAYWSALLGNELTAYGLVENLLLSPEYQARQAKTPGQSLSALSLGPGRVEQRRELAEEQKRREEEAALAAKQRERSPIPATDFGRWVETRPLDEINPVTDALLHGRRADTGQRINVAYIHLSQTRGVRVSPGDRGRAVVGTWAEEIGAHVAVNGNWYGPWDGPAVSGGQVYGGSDHFYTAVFGFTADGDAIIEHHRATNDVVDERIVEAVSGHPTLIYRGEPTIDFGGDPAFTNRHPRTAIGLDESGDVLILVTVDGRSRIANGMTGAETTQLMAELGAHDAVMLDGGGSSTMWIAGQGIVNRPSGSPRAVGNQIAVFGD